MEEVINYIKSLNINSNVVLACSYGPINVFVGYFK